MGELTASYVYMSMATFFARESVALPGLQEFFAKASTEEREHAQKLIDYITKRGGKVQFANIIAPKTEWDSPLSALEEALALEKSVNQSLLDLHAVADEHKDPHLCDYIEGESLPIVVLRGVADFVLVVVHIWKRNPICFVKK